MPRAKLPLPVKVILVVGPVFLIGATWFMAGNIAPACTITERSRLPAPDGTLDLVTFARDCGGSEPVSEAAILPTGALASPDQQGFLAIGGSTELLAHWTSSDAVEAALPKDSEILWQDEVSNGVAITYSMQ